MWPSPTNFSSEKSTLLPAPTVGVFVQPPAYGSAPPFEQKYTRSESVAAEELCSICLGSRQRERNLPCGHKFCGACIDKWIASSPTAPTCPTCRRKITIPKTLPAINGDVSEDRAMPHQLLDVRPGDYDAAGFAMIRNNPHTGDYWTQSNCQFCGSAFTSVYNRNTRVSMPAQCVSCGAPVLINQRLISAAFPEHAVRRRTGVRCICWIVLIVGAVVVAAILLVYFKW